MNEIPKIVVVPLTASADWPRRQLPPAIWPMGVRWVVDVEISGETARVWPLTNDAPRLERYQVNFGWERGGWGESLSAGGFQTGRPQRIVNAITGAM